MNIKFRQSSMNLPSTTNIILEKHNLQVLQFISKHAQYQLNLMELASVSAQKQSQEICYKRHFDNRVKEVLNKIHQVCLSTKSIYIEVGLERLFQIFHRTNLIACNIAAKMFQELQQKNRGKQNTVERQRSITSLTKKLQQKQQGQLNTQQKNEIVHKRLSKKWRIEPKLEINRKLGGTLLEKQTYGTLKKNEKQNKPKQLRKSDEQGDTDNYQYFRKKVFQKISSELEEVQRQICCRTPDQIETFMLFQKKFLETFNHASREQDIKRIQIFFTEALEDATKFIKNYKFDEQFSIVKIKFKQFMQEITKSKETQQNEIMEKFQRMKKSFHEKKRDANQKLTKRLAKYEELLSLKNKRVEVGINTTVKQIKTLKVFERMIEEQNERIKSMKDQLKKDFLKKLEETDKIKHELEEKIIKKSLLIEELERENKKLHEKIIETKQEMKSIKKSQSKGIRMQNEYQSTLNIEKQIQQIQQDANEEIRQKYFRVMRKIFGNKNNNEKNKSVFFREGLQKMPISQMQITSNLQIKQVNRQFAFKTSKNLGLASLKFVEENGESEFTKKRNKIQKLNRRSEILLQNIKQREQTEKQSQPQFQKNSEEKQSSYHININETSIKQLVSKQKQMIKKQEKQVKKDPKSQRRPSIFKNAQANKVQSRLNIKPKLKVVIAYSLSIKEQNSRPQKQLQRKKLQKQLIEIKKWDNMRNGQKKWSNSFVENRKSTNNAQNNNYHFNFIEQRKPYVHSLNRKQLFSNHKGIQEHRSIEKQNRMRKKVIGQKPIIVRNKCLSYGADNSFQSPGKQIPLMPLENRERAIRGKTFNENINENRYQHQQSINEHILFKKYNNKYTSQQQETKKLKKKKKNSQLLQQNIQSMQRKYRQFDQDPSLLFPTIRKVSLLEHKHF